MFSRSFARATRVLTAAALVLVPASTAVQQASAQASDPRFFAQTNYRVDNDSFWDFFQHRGSWMLMHSKMPGLLDVIHRGEAFLSRLEGEWPMRYRAGAA